MSSRKVVTEFFSIENFYWASWLMTIIQSRIKLRKGAHTVWPHYQGIKQWCCCFYDRLSLIQNQVIDIYLEACEESVIVKFLVGSLFAGSLSKAKQLLTLIQITTQTHSPSFGGDWGCNVQRITLFVQQQRPSQANLTIPEAPRQVSIPVEHEKSKWLISHRPSSMIFPSKIQFVF